jgi:uncharacterized protein (TIGR03083 family)
VRGATRLGAQYGVRVSLSTDQQIDAIRRHGLGIATAAQANLGQPVQHCPGWSVADLVWHVTNVYWFWGTIAREKLSGPPDESRRPARPPDDQLVPTFQAGVRDFVDVLRDAKPKTKVWTWAEKQHQNIAFIIRHQVQEALVHQWDVCRSAGRAWSTVPEVAVDCVDEFLEISVSGELGGELVLHSTDTGDSWILSDGKKGLEIKRGKGARPPKVAASSAGLLLWLYGRIDLGYDGPPELMARFRELCNTS